MKELKKKVVVQSNTVLANAYCPTCICSGPSGQSSGTADKLTYNQYQ